MALIGAAVLVFGGGGDNDSDDEVATDAATASEEELIASGPMTWQKAEQEAETASVDWGPNCDTDTGRIKLVSVYAPPCVEPFEGDNGGATSPGSRPTTSRSCSTSPTRRSTRSWRRRSPVLAPTSARRPPAETVQGFADLYNKLYETYGRTVEVETYIGTGAGDDREAARADAIAIAEMDPFMVVGGPSQSSAVFAAELASRGIVCGPLCTLAMPEAFVEEYAPVHLGGATPEQAAALAAEMIGKLAGPGKAELAGDDATRAKDRVYGLLHYDTPDGDFEARVRGARRAVERQRHRVGNRRRVHARPGPRPGERPHQRQSAEGSGRHHDHLHG